MKETIRATWIALAIPALLLPVVYVGGEGLFYVVWGRTYFAEGTIYRKVYAPLDAASDRLPALYDARETLANGWLRASGEEPGVIVHPLPSEGCL